MVDVRTPEESNVTYELGVLEELQSVFSPEMAYASYIPFYCLIGEKHILLAFISVLIGRLVSYFL